MDTRQGPVANSSKGSVLRVQLQSTHAVVTATFNLIFMDSVAIGESLWAYGSMVVPHGVRFQPDTSYGPKQARWEPLVAVLPAGVRSVGDGVLPPIVINTTVVELDARRVRGLGDGAAPRPATLTGLIQIDSSAVILAARG